MRTLSPEWSTAPSRNAFDVELPRNLRERLCGLAVVEHRLVREHSQGADLPQLRDQRLRHAVHEVVLLVVARKVLEWKHRNGGDFDCRRPGRRAGRAVRPTFSAASARSHCRQPDQELAVTSGRGRRRSTRSRGAVRVPVAAPFTATVGAPVSASSTGQMKRYPRRGKVSMKRGVSAESPALLAAC